MYKDMKGLRFGDLEVKEFAYTKHSHAYWKCFCHNCNSYAIISGANLRSGNSRKCGKCFRKLPNKIRKKVRRYYAKGHTQVETAKRFGISRHTVRAIIREREKDT